MWPSHAVLPSFSSYFPPINYYQLPTCPHELPPSSNMPPCKMAHDGHVTRWPFVLTLKLMEWGKMVVFGSWMLYFGRVGSLWGLCAKVGSSWGKKGNYPKNKTKGKLLKIRYINWYGILESVRRTWVSICWMSFLNVWALIPRYERPQ
jgi:hypothetical protein